MFESCMGKDIRFVMLRHGDHAAACLKELSLTFKVLMIEQNPKSYGFINKSGIFAIQLYFLYFFIVKNYRGTFFNGRIRYLIRSNRLRIDTGTRPQNGNQAFVRQMNRTEQSLIVTATNPRCCRERQQLVGWLL